MSTKRILLKSTNSLRTIPWVISRVRGNSFSLSLSVTVELSVPSFKIDVTLYCLSLYWYSFVTASTNGWGSFNLL